MADRGRHSLIVETPLGLLGLVFTDRGLCRLDFQGHVEKGPVAEDALSRETARALQQYAAGKNVRFKIPLDISIGTPFQQAVWRVLITIPHGETRSYGWVAQQIGRPRATRAVGAACGANPVPIIVPCHRVIASNGSLGGFSSGLEMKKRLLVLEGICNFDTQAPSREEPIFNLRTFPA